jgi:hypothetical protein
VAGTATAVSGRVQRRQAERYADRDAQLAAQRDASYDQYAAPQQYAPPPQQYAPQEAAEPAADPIQQLKDLAGLRDQGILTDEEFAVQKAKILNR